MALQDQEDRREMDEKPVEESGRAGSAAVASRRVPHRSAAQSVDQSPANSSIETCQPKRAQQPDSSRIDQTDREWICGSADRVYRDQRFGSLKRQFQLLPKCPSINRIVQLCPRSEPKSCLCHSVYSPAKVNRRTMRCYLYGYYCNMLSYKYQPFKASSTNASKER